MNRDYKAIAIESFSDDASTRDEFLDVVADMLERADAMGGTSESKAQKAVGEGLIYEEDQWEVLRHYCDVNDANYAHAEQRLIEDVAKILDGLDDD